MRFFVILLCVAGFGCKARRVENSTSKNALAQDVAAENSQIVYLYSTQQGRFYCSACKASDNVTEADCSAERRVTKIQDLPKTLESYYKDESRRTAEAIANDTNLERGQRDYDRYQYATPEEYQQAQSRYDGTVQRLNVALRHRDTVAKLAKDLPANSEKLEQWGDMKILSTSSELDPGFQEFLFSACVVAKPDNTF